MKVYHYNHVAPHELIYTGNARSNEVLPPNCTTKSPPTIPVGKVAAFSVELGVWTVRDATVKVPTEVSMWKAKSVLALRGYTAQIEHELNTLPEPSATVAKLKWQHATIIARNDPLVTHMTTKFGWSVEDVDSMFIEAAQLT